ncbi:MAG: recombination protein RecR [Clostridiales bacterium]|nr:recombination protein RecR [Clostridiales bacterium]
MGYDVAPLSRLIEEFERMPSIGRKTAQRLAFYVLGLPRNEAEDFASAILEAHEKIHRCPVCCNLTDGELCNICSNPARDTGTICVVEDSRDVLAIERTHEYMGVYHVLNGLLSPLNGVGPDSLSIKELVRRTGGEVKEVIMATDPTAEGETTAMYVSKLLKPLGVKVTRLAYGVPVGADLEYADEVTLMRALEGRQII